MAFRLEGSDIIIDGFEKGIASTPFDGIADMRDVNIISVPNEASVNYATGASTLPPTGLGTVTFTSTTTTFDYLVVAGGGGGGGSQNVSEFPGGGGAGGMLTGSTIGFIQTYAVTVGAGGVGGVGNQDGSSGANSVLGTISTATGGGGGGKQLSNGIAGGSGGGAGEGGGAGGTGTVGQGNNGAAAAGGSGLGSGGGGAGGAGSVHTGGVGSASSISGSSVTYAAGGDGVLGNGAAGTTNRGNGGQGGGYSGGAHTGGAGGSGIVVISYTTGAFTATGGTITTSGGNTIHTFTTSGTFEITAIAGYTANTLTTASTTGFVNGMAVKITSSSIGGVTNGDVYYVGNITSTTFKLYAKMDLSGSAVTITSGGTATFTVVTFGIPVDKSITTSPTFNSAGQNYQYVFIVCDDGNIWYIGNDAQGTLNHLVLHELRSPKNTNPHSHDARVYGNPPEPLFRCHWSVSGKKF